MFPGHKCGKVLPKTHKGQASEGMEWCWGQLVYARKHRECFVFLSGVTSPKDFLAQKACPQSKLRNNWTAKMYICSLLQSGTLSQTTVQVLLRRQMWSLPYLQSDSRPDSLR